MPRRNPSPLAQKLSGVYIEDSTKPLPTTVAWVQKECREGKFTAALEQFASTQQENLNVGLTTVDRVDNEGIVAFVPCKLRDHESTHAYRADVWLRLNPLTEQIQRLEQTPA